MSSKIFNEEKTCLTIKIKQLKFVNKLRFGVFTCCFLEQTLLNYENKLNKNFVCCLFVFILKLKNA